MVRFGDPAHHAGPARPILADHRLGGRVGAHHEERGAAKCCRLVLQTRADIQRCDCRRPSRTVGAAEFIHVPATGRNHHNINQIGKSNLPDSINGRLNCGKSSIELPGNCPRRMGLGTMPCSDRQSISTISFNSPSCDKSEDRSHPRLPEVPTNESHHCRH